MQNHNVIIRNYMSLRKKISFVKCMQELQVDCHDEDGHLYHHSYHYHSFSFHDRNHFINIVLLLLSF